MTLSMGLSNLGHHGSTQLAGARYTAGNGREGWQLAARRSGRRRHEDAVGDAGVETHEPPISRSGDHCGSGIDRAIRNPSTICGEYLDVR